LWAWAWAWKFKVLSAVTLEATGLKIESRNTGGPPLLPLSTTKPAAGWKLGKSGRADATPYDEKEE
jgi:hypothetical protein